MIEIMYLVALIALFIGSITDIRTREVPDWLNYGLIFSGIGINMIFSAVYWDLSYLINSAVGFLIFLILACIMFYAGQWGGGDSKMLMGLGALIGIPINFEEFPFLASFLINTLIVGAVYGFAWSLALSIKNIKKFSKAAKKIINNNLIIKTRRAVLLMSLALFISSFFVQEFRMKILLFGLVFVSIITFYIWIFIKAVEKSCMLKFVKPQQLTEGDWIAKDINIGGKYISGPKDLGISKNKIKKLISFYKAGKIKKVLIKEGIPFVPSFFIAFILTMAAGNIVALFILH